MIIKIDDKYNELLNKLLEKDLTKRFENSKALLEYFNQFDSNEYYLTLEPAGVYILEISINNESIQKKIIVK